MFFGFGRSTIDGRQEYIFNLIPTGIPLQLPYFGLPQETFNFTLWLFDFGNFAAFIPFGIFIPLFFRYNFIQFIVLFCSSIFILETLQTLTFLGSFDINDVIVNTLGATVGFFAYKIGIRSNNILKKIVITGVTTVILSIGVLVVADVFNPSPSVIALHKLTESQSNLVEDNNFSSFEVADENINPKLNVYSSKGENFNQYTYQLEGKYTQLSGFVGIPDDINDYQGSVVISVDGKERMNQSYSKDIPPSPPGYFTIGLENANELKITFNDSNILLWDVTLLEF
ncbi:VanZ family protein [Chengkuizengella sp. YPA3-1-1]|uniref:VanZ family protein n=2 Tax=Chengkuizengella marina TaxID=2507566 RepID=A0A6N9Q1R7_9BACL|nr:VanZ family protein [Chengkuizengella marina]